MAEKKGIFDYKLVTDLLNDNKLPELQIFIQPAPVIKIVAGIAVMAVIAGLIIKKA